MKIIIFIPLILISIECYSQKNEYKIDEIKIELDSINISKIKSACDCSNGMEKIANILYKTTEKFSSRAEILNDSLGVQIVILTTKKTKEVSKKCENELRLKDSDILECNSFKSFKEKSEILNKKFRN
ncbi:MAG: hypothetical protein O9267_13815 [Flavobacterium sp.]|uniref:hypothetical protein n=1 Tax=Flavobacterium sp. TaxID=239 RepID=UPI0022C55850|nr:hypothetical protein [Flavobacterium sp.]MCZ8198676.1 hypothetical protein [Flavobacterium sp.]